MWTTANTQTTATATAAAAAVYNRGWLCTQRVNVCVCVQERNGISSTHTQRPMRTSCYVLCLKRIQSAVIRSNVSTSTKAALFDFVGSISGIPHIWTLTFWFDRLLINFGFVVIFMCCANDFFNFVHQRKINIERRNGTSWTRTSK